MILYVYSLFSLSQPFIKYTSGSYRLRSRNKFKWNPKVCKRPCLSYIPGHPGSAWGFALPHPFKNIPHSHKNKKVDYRSSRCSIVSDTLFWLVLERIVWRKLFKHFSVIKRLKIEIFPLWPLQKPIKKEFGKTL